MRWQASVYSKRAVGILLLTAILTAGCDVVKVSKGESNPGILYQARNLGFKEGTAGDGDPTAWDRRGGEPENFLFAVDTETKRSGKSSASIRLKPDIADTAELDTSLIQCVTPDSFIGKPFRFQGWIKTDAAEGEGAALWIGASDSNNLTTGGWFPADDEWRRGTLDWSLYEADTEALSEETTRVCFGPILYGPGRAWFDELKVR